MMMTTLANIPHKTHNIGHTTPTLTNVAPIRALLLITLACLLLPSTCWHPNADAATIVMKPSGGSATLVPGQSLHFECAQIGRPYAQFVWLKQTLAATEDAPRPQPVLLEPNLDDTIEIHNERLTLNKPNYQSVGDYICRDLKNETELAVIKLRAPPYIDDFGIETSHTGKSTVVADGDRLVLTCHIRDESVPINITWLRSYTPDNEHVMVPLPEYDPTGKRYGRDRPLDDDPYMTPTPPSPTTTTTTSQELLIPTYTSPSNVIVEQVDKFTKRLVIQSVGQQHRGFYACMVDNGVTERSRKTIYVRVKDNIVALWPFLGIVAELFILFTIIYVWETQRAQKSLDMVAGGPAARASGTPAKTAQPVNISKRPASGPSNAFESVPLNR